MGRGDILVFTTQDAYATSSDWLSCLIAPLADPAVAGVYGRQMAHLDAHPPETYFLDFLYGSTSRTQRAGARHELSMQTTMFSNVASAIRRDVFDASAFVEGMIMSEDQEWAVRMLLAGYTLRYAADAVVRHSHPYSLSQAFRRFFDSGVSAEQTYLAGARPSARCCVRRRCATRAASCRGCGGRATSAGCRTPRCTRERSSAACRSARVTIAFRGPWHGSAARRPRTGAIVRRGDRPSFASRRWTLAEASGARDYDLAAHCAGVRPLKSSRRPLRA